MVNPFLKMNWILSVFLSCAARLVLLIMIFCRTNFFTSFSISLFKVIFEDFLFILDSKTYRFFILLLIIYLRILCFRKLYISHYNNQNEFYWILFSFVIRIMFTVRSGRILTFFIGWDGLGLRSFWLILWYSSAERSHYSGIHTFFTIRVGDVFIVLSICLWGAYRSTFFYSNWAYLLGVIFFVFCAFTKSAQFPFVSWLPLAIAAPTPISALVHSSTLVTAGIFILIRAGFYNGGFPLLICYFFIWFGGITRLIGALFSCIENDLKKAIAFSTLRHCGVIVFGLAICSIDVVYFHLTSHALLKSMLFIIAGWALVYRNSSQDLRRFGRNVTERFLLKRTWILNAINMCGIPFIGIWYSKHSILNLGVFSSFICILIITLRALSGVYIWRITGNIIFNAYGPTVRLEIPKKQVQGILIFHLLIITYVLVDQPFLGHFHIRIIDWFYLLTFIITPVILINIGPLKSYWTVNFTPLVNSMFFKRVNLEITFHERPLYISKRTFIKLREFSDMRRNLLNFLGRFLLTLIFTFAIIIV